MRKISLVLILAIYILSGCNITIKGVPEINEVLSIRVIKANYSIVESGGQFNELKTNKINNNDNVYFSDNEFFICLKFNEECSRDYIESIITVSPKFNYEIIEKDNYEWYLKPTNWNIGDNALFTLKSNNESYTLNLQKVEKTKVMKTEIVEPSYRESLNYCQKYTQDIYIPSESTLKITFSNEVDKESVLNVLAKQFTGDKKFFAEYSFIDEKTLTIKLSNKEDSSIVLFTLLNAKDTYGCNIDDKDGYMFLLENKKSLARYNTVIKTEDELFSPKVIDTASLSSDCSYFVYTDYVQSIIDNGDIPNHSTYDSLLNVYSFNNDEIINIKGLKRRAINAPNYIICGNKYFFYNDSIYNSNGMQVYTFTEDIRNACFSPDENRIAISYVNQFPDLKYNTTNIDIFDLNTKSIVNSFELERYNFDIETDQYDTSKINFIFLDLGTLLFETNQSKLKTLNISTSEITDLTYGIFASKYNNPNNCISPDRKNMIINNSDETIIINTMTKEKIYKFPNDIEPQSLVWGSNNEIYFINHKLLYKEGQREKIFVLNEKYKIEELGIKGTPIYCDEIVDYILLRINNYIDYQGNFFRNCFFV